MSKNLIKALSIFISFCLIFEQTAFAQSIDLSHYFAQNPGKAISQSDKFRPLHLRYLGYDNLSNDFKLLLDKGDAKKEDLENKAYIEENTQTLLKYFFIGLSLPNEKFWVNLRPDSPDNILDPELEKTDIGRIFLEADVQLKKDTAGMTSPQTPEGKAYWDKLYKKAGELFGTENITIPTITRPWIVPNEIIIREAPDNAYIYKATLKVMLEEDYLSRGRSRTAPTLDGSRTTHTPDQYTFSDPRLKELNQYSTQIIKEAIIPKLTYAVNTSKRYAPLRQVYYSLILAQWFKQKYGSSGSIRVSGASAPVNSYIDLIDSGNLTNLACIQPYDKQSYFKQYQKSFAEGEYNLQEPVYTPMGQSVRRYMSGGMQINCSSAITEGRVSSLVALPPVNYDDGYIISAETIEGRDVILNSSSSIFESSNIKEKKEKTRKLLDIFGKEYDLNSAMIFKNELLIKIKIEDQKIAFMNIAISIAEKLKKFKKEKNEYIDYTGWFFNSVYIYIYDHFINKKDMKIEDVLDSLNRFDMRFEESGYMEAVLYFMSGRPEEELKNILLSKLELPDTAVVEVNDITRVITKDKIRELLEIPSNNILVLDSTADDHSFPYVFESMLKDIQDLSSITKVKIPEARYQNFKSKIDIAVIIEPRQEDSNIFEIELTARDGQKKTIKYCINQERNAHISTNKIFLLDVNQIEDLEKLPLGSIAGSIAYFASRLRHALPLLGFLPIQINNGNGYMKVVQHTKEEMKYLLESFNVFENIFNRPNFNFPGLYDTVKKEISALKNIVGSTQGRENIESLSSVSSAVKNKPQLINREEMLGIKLKQDEAEFMSVLSKDKFLNLSKDEKRLLRVVGDILAVIVGGVIFLGHSGKPYIPIPEVRETIFNMAKELNIDIVVTDRLLLGIINKINTTLSGNPSFKDKYQKLFAYAIARYYYQHYFIPVSGGKAPAVAEPFDLSQSGDLINRGPAALWGAGLAGIHWITVANGKHNIYLIDNNSFVVTILDQFKRLAEKQNVEIVNEDVTDDNFADKISQKFDLIMVTKMLHEAGRTVTGAIETVTNKEKEIPLHGKDAQLARSKLYQNLSLSLTKTGAAMIFEVSPGDQWNSKTITNEIEKEGKLQVTGSNDHSINGRIVSQVNVEVKVSSSPVVGRDLQQFGSDADKKGGIAFNALPIQTESIVSSALGALSGARIFKGDLDEEWTKIQSVYNAGIRPSIQRLSEYTVAAIASPLAEDKIDQVRVMLADILRRDEESQKLTPAEESCKQLLRTLESG